MPIKNIIVRMADRLRAGEAGSDKDATAHASADSFASRQNILHRLYGCLAARVAADARYSPIKCIVKPDIEKPTRVMLVRDERVVTLRIAPGSEYYTVAGSGI